MFLYEFIECLLACMAVYGHASYLKNVDSLWTTHCPGARLQKYYNWPKRSTRHLFCFSCILHMLGIQKSNKVVIFALKQQNRTRTSYLKFFNLCFCSLPGFTNGTPPITLKKKQNKTKSLVKYYTVLYSSYHYICTPHTPHSHNNKANTR